MKLQAIEITMLRLVAQDGDYERLDLLLTEFKEHLPASTDRKKLAAAQRTLQTLVDKKLVQLYKRRRQDRANYTPIAPKRYRRVIARDRCWHWNESDKVEIGAAPTPEGERVYELGT